MKLLQSQTVQKRYIQLCNKILEIENKYKEKKDKEISVINKQIDELHKRCPHKYGNVVYYGDPAGGSDSYYKCKDCGLWSKNRIKEKK